MQFEVVVGRRWLRGPLVVAVIGSLALGLVLPGTGVAQQAEQRRLEAAREQLGAIARELAAADQQAAAAQRSLGEAEATLRAVESIVNDVAMQVEHQRGAVGDAERELAAVEHQSDGLHTAYVDRIARLYKQGPDLTFEAMMSSQGPDEAIARTVMLERVTRGDQVDLERLGAARTAVDAQRDRLLAEQRRLEDLLAEQELVLAQAEELRSSRALRAAAAASRVEDLRGQHDDLEAEEGRLEALIRRQQAEAERQRREAARRAAAAAAAAAAAPAAPTIGSAGYAWPLCAPVTSNYGPRWGRMHRGVDQGARTGTAIRAARGGTVIFAGWQGGYGNLVLIDHGGGAVTAYAHQSRFAVGRGQAVSRGQVIGYVGSTGNSTGPHLHFEIRVNGSAVNPRQYLPGSPC